MNASYIYEIFRLKCSPDLIALGLFPNHKEWSESIAAYNAAVQFSGFSRSDSNVTVVVVGDGHTPRTGAMFAFRSNWNVISIDPNMRLLEKWSDIKRLKVVRDKVTDRSETIKAEKAIIVGVHSHAKASDSWNLVESKKKIFVNMPCCYESDMSFQYSQSYRDDLIPSEKNKIEIYENYWSQK